VFDATAPLLLQRAIRSAEAETLCQKPGAGMRQAVRVGQEGRTRTVRPARRCNRGHREAARGRPGSSRGAVARSQARIRNRLLFLKNDSLYYRTAPQLKSITPLMATCIYCNYPCQPPPSAAINSTLLTHCVLCNDNKLCCALKLLFSVVATSR
jgi:hypothetical protein